MAPDNEEVTPEAVPEPVAAVEPVVEPTPQYVTKEMFESSFGQLMSQIQNISAQRAVAVPQPPQRMNEPTDDELFAAAQQGNRDAFATWTDRRAEKLVNQRLSEQQRAGLVNQQLTAIFTKYPELGNPNHQLTQRVNAFKNVLLQMGAPDSPQTNLDACLRAITDSRDLIGASRPVGGVRAPATGQIPAQHRQAPATSGGMAVSAEEIALARKMGVKDAGKAKEKFWQRNAEGKSSVSPTISAALNMEQGNA